MNSAIRLSCLLLLAAATAGEAAATVSLQFSKIGFTQAELTSDPDRAVRVRFNAVSDGAGAARQFSNISGSMTYQLLGVTHTTVGSNVNSAWTFGVKIINTSTAPMTSARISAVGFSTAAAGATGDNPDFLNISNPTISGSLFDEVIFTNGGGLNIPQVGGSNSPQVCLKTSTQGNGCTGGAGDGLNMGSGANLGTASNPFPVTSSQFVLNFTGPSARTAITLHNLAIRFQSLSGTGQSGAGNGTLDGDSGVGIVTNVEIVPEPSSWAMLITGFGLCGRVGVACLHWPGWQPRPVRAVDRVSRTGVLSPRSSKVTVRSL